MTTANNSTRQRQPAPTVAKPDVHEAVPALGWYSDDLLFGEVWERPALCKRDRSFLTVSALITRGHQAQLVGHFTRALNFGISPTEIAEIVTHLAFYCGWPAPMSAVGVMREVFGSRGIGFDQVKQSTSPHLPLPPVQDAENCVAPALREMTQRVIIDDLWKRTELAPRDRSLITISTLIAQAQWDQLAAEVSRGLRNGLTQIEISEAATHLAFYVGWPSATASLATLESVFSTFNN